MQKLSFKLTRDRTLPPDVLKSIVNLEVKIGPPSPVKHNKFLHLQLADFHENEEELSKWTLFNKNMNDFSTKTFFQKENITLPGVKTFFSIPEEHTEKSTFTSIAVLNESADCKDTVLKLLNFLHDKVVG